MGKGLRIIIGSLLIVFFGCSISNAQDLNKIVNNFYGGLADIIEQNMDNPNVCIQEVDRYYRQNQKTVNQIRELSEAPIKDAAQKMDEYMSMSEKGPETIAEDMEKQPESIQNPHTLPGANRYVESLTKFSTKYPQQGLEIAAKAVQLIPNFDMEEH